MKRCAICNVRINNNEIYCPYCGYRNKFGIEYNDYLKKYLLESKDNNGIDLNNVGKRLFSKHRARVKNSIVYKINNIEEQIKKEKEKIETINISLNHINNKELKVKIKEIRDKIESLLESLIICKYNYEYIKYIINLNTIEANINKINPTNIDNLLNEDTQEYNDWINNIKYESQISYNKNYIEGLNNKYNSIKEKIALKLIEKLLVNSTLLKIENEDKNNLEENNEKEIGTCHII